MLAGFGRAVITPEPPVMLGRFGDRHEQATEVHELEVPRSASRARGAVCLVVCDLLGTSATFAHPIRRRLLPTFASPPRRC
jgi:hypothetical protein